MDAFDRPLYILELVGRVHFLTVGMLARQPGWTTPTASRCLAKLCVRGWLERVNEKGYPKYTLGRKPLNLIPDLKF